MSYSWHIAGERIRENRLQKKLSQYDLAEAVSQTTGNNITRQTVSGWENGTPIKKIEQLTALCEIFDCDVAYLLCECDTKHISTEHVRNLIGLSKEATDILIEQKKMGSPLSDTLSKVIENKNLLYQIHDCCTASYCNSDYDAYYEELFTRKQRLAVMTPVKMENLNLMLLYNSLKAFVDSCRASL